MSLPSIDDLVRIGCERSGMGNWTPQQVELIKGMWGITNPYIARAAEAVGYPAREEFGMFATVIRDAVLDALIAEAEEEHRQGVANTEYTQYVWMDYDDVADWLRSMKDSLR